MTTEVTQDFNWDDVESPNIENMETGDADESTRGKVLFARYRYFHIPVEWAKGSPGFPLPGVFQDRYDQATNHSNREGPYFVKGALPKGGSKNFVNVIVAEATDKNGQTYQRVDQFTSFDETWRKFAWPALAQLGDNFAKLQATGQAAINLARQKKTPEQINAEPSTWVYGRSTLAKSDITRKKQDGSDTATYYRSEWALFANAQEWTAARDNFFAQFATANGTAPLDLKNIPAKWLTADNPAKWTADVVAMSKYIKESAASMSVIDLAKTFSVVDKETGKPFLNQEGKPIDPVALLAPILDVPPALLMATFA